MINGVSGASLSQSEIQQLSSTERRQLIRSGEIQCPACASRKYKDGSDEMVSFKAAAHISPAAAGTAVRAHEQEHVANAYSKAAKAGNARVLQASVSISTSVCPECGRSYVSGGKTRTQILYHDDAYAQNTKGIDKTSVPGSNMDMGI